MVMWGPQVPWPYGLTSLQVPKVSCWEAVTSNLPPCSIQCSFSGDFLLCGVMLATNILFLLFLPFSKAAGEDWRLQHAHPLGQFQSAWCLGWSPIVPFIIKLAAKDLTSGDIWLTSRSSSSVPRGSSLKGHASSLCNTLLSRLKDSIRLQTKTEAHVDNSLSS